MESNHLFLLLLLPSIWAGTPIDPAGHCIWYDNCGLDVDDQENANHILPCYDEGQARAISAEDIET